MKRVMIVGQPGAGKTWLARELGRRTGLPVHHMDMIHWKPGWVERDRAGKQAMARRVEESESWIFEGGLSATMPNRLVRADTVILLDVPFVVRVWRVFVRTIRDYGQTRPDLPENCPERFDREFWGFIWRTRVTARQRNRSLIRTAAPKTVVHVIQSRRDVAEFLQSLDATEESGHDAGHGTHAN
jgi:adenylate kinase family enzyme